MSYESALVFGLTVLVLASAWTAFKATQIWISATREVNKQPIDALPYFIAFLILSFFAYGLNLMLPFPK